LAVWPDGRAGVTYFAGTAAGDGCAERVAGALDRAGTVRDVDGDAAAVFGVAGLAGADRVAAAVVATFGAVARIALVGVAVLAARAAGLGLLGGGSGFATGGAGAAADARAAGMPSPGFARWPPGSSAVQKVRSSAAFDRCPDAGGASTTGRRTTRSSSPRT
jgi:hypothetical protein